MRLVVLGSGHPFRGGVARATTEMVDALAARGHDLRFLTPRRQYPRLLFPGVDDRDPDACPRLDSADPVLDPLNPLSWPRARTRARSRAAEAWIIPFWTWAWAPWWVYLLSGPHPPAIAVVHNPADHDAGRRHRVAARAVLGRCRGLFTHARVLEEALGGAYPGRPTGSHPLPSAPVGPLPDAASARSELGLSGPGRLALFLGLIRPYKGLDALLEAFAGLDPGSDWRLLVAGEPWGGAAAAIEERVQSLGLGERVRLRLGWVPEAEVPTLLAAADLVVLPYLRGSQSAVAPLAFGAGVPVLSTRVGGLPEIVRHGVDGWLVEPGSAAALTAALRDLDRERLLQLAEGARRWSERVTWDGYAAALEAVVARVLAETTQAARVRTSEREPPAKSNEPGRGQTPPLR